MSPRANKDGQTVVPGVDTDSESDNKKYQAEKRRFADIITNTMERLTTYVSVTQQKQTYRANMVLDIVMAVIGGINECASKSGDTGTIRIVIRPQLDKCKVELSYNTVLYENEKAVGKVINKKELFGKKELFQPIDYDDFDERQRKNIK